MFKKKRTLRAKRPEPYPRHRTHPAIMGCGGKDKPGRVIDSGQVLEYVGIGWIEIRPASAAGFLRYPVLTEE